MSNEHLTEIETRIRSLELHLRVTRWALVGAVACGLGLAGLHAATPTRPAAAPSFELRDPDGRVRARLAMKGQDPSFELLTAIGTTVLELKGAETPSLLLKDSRTPESDFLMAFPTSISMKRLTKGMIVLDLNEPQIYVSDAVGFQSIVGVSRLENATGTQTKTSAASMNLFDKDGKLIWGVPQ